MIASAQSIARLGLVKVATNLVTGGVDFTAGETLELITNDVVVVVQEIAPPSVAERGGARGRADDVGEDDGREHPVGLEAAPHAGEEFFDLVEQQCGLPHPVKGVGAG